MNQINTPNDINAQVLAAIQKGAVTMKPRWRFMAVGIAAAAVAFVVFCAAVYVLSLGIFLMQQDGTWFVPRFGQPGWQMFFFALPLPILLFAGIFVMVLQYLLKRLDLGYRHSVLAIFTGLAALSVVGGLVTAQTPLHRGFAQEAHRGGPWSFMEMWYGDKHHHHPPSIYRGTIVAAGLGSVTLAMLGDEGTTTVLISPSTRLPSGADFKQGDTLVVMGDEIATDTVRAFGIQEIDPME